MFLNGVSNAIVPFSITYLLMLVVVVSHFDSIPQISAFLYALLVGLTGISMIFSDVDFQTKLQINLLSLLFIVSDFILYKIVINKRKK
jgi:hypothetical protein